MSEKKNTADTSSVNNNGKETPDILAVATRQRAMMLTLLAYIAVIIGTMFFPVVRQNEYLLMIPVILAIVFFTARLCWVVYGKGAAILLTVLSCVPYVSIIIMLLVSSRATKMLKEKGLKVGLLGANIKEVAGLGRSTETAS